LKIPGKQGWFPASGKKGKKKAQIEENTKKKNQKEYARVTIASLVCSMKKISK
jgi:hypothetical protein